MTIKIDKDVPLPTTRFYASQFPFDLMDVGDSFFVPTASMGTVRSMASRRSTRNQMRYSVRRVENGARVWRVE